MFRLLRLTLALFGFSLITLLFLDFTGALHAYLAWLAQVQFLPALLAGNLAVVAALVLMTLLFGRVYCSVICPLGILQDIISHLSGRRKGKARRFSYSPAKNWLRYTVLALFVAALLAGIGSVVALLAPYSAFGRIVSNLLSPIYALVNNGLAYLAERAGSYAFYEVKVWVHSLPTFGVALGTFILLAVLAWRHGRTYCNTLCPVGTLLGLLSRFSLFAPRIDTEKCVSCGLCAKQCKASCIDPKEHRIDSSRCVACMNCLGACSKGAIRYGLRRGSKLSQQAAGTAAPASPARRNFLMGGGMALATAATRQAEKLVDGGLAPIADKQRPARQAPILPPGARSARHFAAHCTGCQLCVAACPSGVLRPSASLSRLMQPECSYEHGYCRPECTKCSEVCPAGAILPLAPEEKYSTQIGHAVWQRERCVVLRDGVKCGACARHCPVGAITLVPLDPADPNSPEIPAVNEERCIGCGKCEHLCPARPHSAIHVEGHAQHKTL